MKPRVEIKEEAKIAFKEQYWLTVAVLVIAAVAMGIVSQVLTPALSGVLSYFLLFPIWISLSLFFIKIYTGQRGDLKDLISGFYPYGRNIGAMFWMYLWLILWTLLLIIPGIIKYFAYMFTPYLLAEYPNLRATDAVKVSMKITDGYKMDLFVFYLSYLGWFILCGLTFGVLYVFYVGPYFNTALAGCYQELKNVALANGRVSPADLGEIAAPANIGENEIEIDMSRLDDGN